MTASATTTTLAAQKEDKTAETETAERKRTNHIIITECPANPCRVFYYDIFGKIIVECRSSNHQNNKKLDN